jgi:hypothetical protein
MYGFIFTEQIFPYLCFPVYSTVTEIQLSPDGGIGRRAGLKHQWPQGCAGSIPAPGTFAKHMKSSFHSYKRTLIAITIFGIMMAALEAIVVIYLRQLYYPQEFNAQPAASFLQTVPIEWLREFATIIMLVTVAMIASKNFSGRLAFFLFTFGIWDIFYYVWLYILIGWPESLFTWDLLFLIPVPWVGPVLAPVICSLTMIFIALYILNHVSKGLRIRFGLGQWLLIALGVIAILFTFMQDYTAILIQEYLLSGLDGLIQSPHFQQTISQFIPTHFNWPIFAIGEILIIIGFYLSKFVSTNSDR